MEVFSLKLRPLNIRAKQVKEKETHVMYYGERSFIVNMKFYLEQIFVAWFSYSAFYVAKGFMKNVFHIWCVCL